MDLYFNLAEPVLGLPQQIIMIYNGRENGVVQYLHEKHVFQRRRAGAGHSLAPLSLPS
jgi:hypothetical protein